MSINRRKVIGRMNAQNAFETNFEFRRPRKDDVLGADRELVANGIDAGASRINIVIDPKKKEYRVEDNGLGFSEEQQLGYFTLFDSFKKGKAGQTGRWGTGRTKAMTFAPELEVFSVSKDFPKGTTTKLTRKMLEELYTNHTINGEWVDNGKLPDWWHLEKGQTGSAVVIHLNDDDWSRMPSAAVVTAELSRYLKLSVAEKVTVNGKPLQKREVVGEPIRRVFSEAELGPALAKSFGGAVEVELFIPSRLLQDEGVRLGGHHPICSIAQFIKQVNDTELTSAIPEILITKGIVGDIFFPALNDHVGEDRESLKDSVLKGMHISIINFLATTLGPILAETYQRHEADQEKAAHARALQSFVDSFNRATGLDPEKVRKLHREKFGKPGDSTPIVDPPIVVNRRTVELCPSDSQKLQVIRLNGVKENNLVWVETTGGKEKQLANGPVFTYVADKLGTFTIVVRDKTKPDSTTVEITIIVDTKKALVITPGRARIGRGESQEFRVRNSDSTSGQLKWECLNAKGTKAAGITIRKRSAEVTLEVVVEIGEKVPLGKYTLRVVDARNADISAETDFVVHQDIPPDLLVIDDVFYRISASPHVQATPITLTQDDEFASPGTSQDVGTILVNFHHSDFLNIATLIPGPLAQNLMLQELVIVAHCEAEFTNGRINSITEFTEKIGALRSKLLQSDAEG